MTTDPPRTTPGSCLSPGSRPLRHVVRFLAALVLVAAPMAAQAAADQPSWRLPLGGEPVVTRPFEQPSTPYGPGHRGVDLAAAPGAMVLAAGSGTIGFAGLVAGRPVISVLHADNLRTTYEPVTPQVRIGQAVATGDPLGILLPGHPGCPVVACLHWGLIETIDGVDVYRDPMTMLTLGPVRLLPWAPSAPAASAAVRAAAATTHEGTTSAAPGSPIPAPASVPGAAALWTLTGVVAGLGVLAVGRRQRLTRAGVPVGRPP